MIRHIVCWSLRPAEDEDTRQAQLAEIRFRLTAMVGVADGLLHMEVCTEPLPGSNAQLALIADFTDEAALAAYQAWPPHVEVAQTLIRPIAETRLCFDTRLG